MARQVVDAAHGTGPWLGRGRIAGLAALLIVLGAAAPALAAPSSPARTLAPLPDGPAASAAPAAAPASLPAPGARHAGGPPTVTQPAAYLLNGELAPSIDAGQVVKFVEAAYGGTPPYNYTWWGLPVPAFGSCNAYNVSDPVCTFLESGTYVVSVNITDAKGLQSGVSAGFPIVVDDPIDVGAPVANLSTGDVGEQVAFSIAPSGGAPPFIYQWSGDTTHCRGNNSDVLVCALESPGTLEVWAAAADTNGATATGTPLNFTVDAPVVLGPTSASRSVVDAGQLVTLNATATGGSGVYPAWSWTGLGTAACPGSAGATIDCTFTAPGVYTILAAVHDSVGGFATSSSSVAVEVDPGLVAGAVELDPTSLDVGQSFTALATPSDGLGPYTVTWSGLPTTGCTVSALEGECAPTTAGTWELGYTVTDANGEEATATPVAVQVFPALQISALANSTSPYVGETVGVLAEPLGGVAPYSVAWQAPGGTTSGLSSSITFTAPGTYTVLVTVRDANGETASAMIDFTVVAPASSTSTLLGLPLLAGGILVLSLGLNLIALAFLVLVLRTRRGAGGSTWEGWDPSRPRTSESPTASSAKDTEGPPASPGAPSSSPVPPSKA